MSTHYLPVIRSNAEFDVSDMTAGVQGGKINLRQMLAYCQAHRIAGIATLFLEANADGLFAHLNMSGWAFVHFLKTTGDANKATGFALPLFDAIASADWTCAQNIAAHSRTTWNAQEEYEDDFLHARFLMMNFFSNVAPEESQRVLARYETVLAGGQDIRLLMDRALLAKDGAMFSEAFEEFLANEQTRYASLLRKDAIAQEIAVTEAKLSVEGLALARLAEKVGFVLQKNYALLPSLVRKPPMTVFDPDAWKAFAPIHIEE